jgi:phosphoribosylformimino-5-aminoimidazole carboxamide ribotide isomerase
MFQIIPAIDLRHGRCVRLEQGDYDRQTVYDGSPIDMAQTWERLGAPLIHLVDLDGAKAGHPVNLATIERICQAVKCPCELGGGIRSLRDIEDALRVGVKRCILGTVIAENPSHASALLEDIAAEDLVAGLDARGGKIAVRGWLESSGREALDLARELFDHGLRQFIYTDIQTDGMFTGPNLAELRKLCRAVPGADVIASGGIGTPEHIRQLVELGEPNLVGVIVGKALYDGRVTYEQLVAAAR